MQTMTEQPIRAVMFDFDGTLIDTMGGFADLAGRLIAAHHGWTVAAGREAYLRTSGVPFFQQLEILFPGDAGNPDLVETFEREKLHCYEDRGLDPDVPALLAGLRARGISSVVSSNNYVAVVEQFLAGQQALFDLVLGYRDNFGKGEPHFAFAEQTLGMERAALLFVGDSVRDAEFAQQCGVRFVAMLGTNPRERFEQCFGPDPFPLVERLTEVLTLIDRGHDRPHSGQAAAAAPRSRT